jgi:hypothetical protein
VREVTARAGPRGYVGKHVCFLPACIALSMGAIDTVPALENARRWLRLMRIRAFDRALYPPLPVLLALEAAPQLAWDVILFSWIQWPLGSTLHFWHIMPVCMICRVHL